MDKWVREQIIRVSGKSVPIFTASSLDLEKNMIGSAIPPGFKEILFQFIVVILYPELEL